jgi:hypothetical protein
MIPGGPPPPPAWGPRDPDSRFPAESGNGEFPDPDIRPIREMARESGGIGIGDFRVCLQASHWQGTLNAREAALRHVRPLVATSTR